MPGARTSLHRNNAAEWAMAGVVWPLRYAVLLVDRLRRDHLRFRFAFERGQPVVCRDLESQIEIANRKYASPSPEP